MTTWFFSLQTDAFYSKIKVRLDVVPFFLHTEPHTEREVYTMRTPRLRLLSVLLAVAMFFTLLPVSALAEGWRQQCQYWAYDWHCWKFEPLG